ncbi:UNVERIFIED_CONTAM: hypothetical protein FKN15_068557 [Acipenser sinensis]
MAVTRRGLPIENITGAEALVESCGDGEPQKKKRETEQSISSSRGETLGSPVFKASTVGDNSQTHRRDNKFPVPCVLVMALLGQSWVVWLHFFALSVSVRCLSRRELFPYGEEVGDRVLEQGDSKLERISLQQPLLFYDGSFSSVYLFDKSLMETQLSSYNCKLECFQNDIHGVLNEHSSSSRTKAVTDD